MSFNLTKEETKVLSSLSDDLKAASIKIQDAVDSYKKSEELLRSPVEEAVTKYNELLGKTREFCQGIVSRAEDEFSDKTEKWQESTTGQSAQEWIDSWEWIELDDVDYQWPDGLSIDNSAHATDLDDLPERMD